MQQERCEGCGFVWDVPIPEAIDLVRHAPARISELFADGPGVRSEDRAGWSPTAYLWHLIDVLRFGAERLLTIALDPGNGVPSWDQEAMAENRGYEQLSHVVGLRVLAGTADGWVAAAEAAPQDGSVAHPERGSLTTPDAIRRNAHEAVHHGLDIQRGLIGPRVSFRPLRDDDADFALMARWLSVPRVLEWYSGLDSPWSQDDVADEYRKYLRGEEPVSCAFILFDGEPVGEIQWYPVGYDRTDGRTKVVAEPLTTWGIDVFIGEPERWHRGIGTEAVRRIIARCYAEGASLVTIDPHVVNERAIRAYEKAGFRKVQILPEYELHDGVLRDAWLMAAPPPDGD